MKVVGIVAEYNPFHNGHAYQIEYIRRELQADYIVAVMSGDFVQRGTPALFPKHMRTEMALKNGVDLVLELPVRVATASAEGFAYGAVEMLHKLGCVDQICFGSECGEIAPFLKIAEILSEEPAEYRELLSSFLKQGKSFPEARSLSLKQSLSDDSLDEFLSTPNNILGLEYCKALFKLHSSIQPVTLKREGSAFHETALNADNLPSASALRKLLTESFTPEYVSALSAQLARQIPVNCVPSVLEAIAQNRFLTEDDFRLLLHHRLLSAIYENNLTDYLDVSPALAQRIQNTINSYQNYNQYTELLKTREITYTRIQRALLHILLNMKSKTPVPDEENYARVLGFHKSASPLLKEIKQNASLTLFTKLADADKTLSSHDKSVLEENIFVSNLYEAALCTKTSKPFLHELQKQILLLP